MSARTIRWTSRALKRLDVIGAHIAKDSPQAAAAVISKLISSVDTLATHPAMGRVGRIAGTRELVIPSLPYIIPYRVTASAVEILTIIHGAQKWPEEL